MRDVLGYGFLTVDMTLQMKSPTGKLLYSKTYPGPLSYHECAGGSQSVSYAFTKMRAQRQLRPAQREPLDASKASVTQGSANGGVVLLRILALGGPASFVRSQERVSR